ncbi:MAG: hypothetical protein A2W33_05350 [Chloroflexi bacterium RBG_16_52_11]|nr:MAG: hypothetical protein A2W33_05350 [Chloroflexi bacterium RBG_16_52_11]
MASLLEVAGPITIIGAQFVYISQPFLSHTAAKNHLVALVELLEEPETTRSFVEFLREGTAQ